jgi:hypothetical protein
VLPKDFIAKITPLAQGTHVPVSFTIAQAALESAWGESELAKQANNLFGMKAGAEWEGPTISLPTHEVVDGKTVEVEAVWRKFESWGSCIADHTRLLTKDERYKAAFDFTDGRSFAMAIAAAGYATDPAYGSKLVEIINQYNLEKPMAEETPVTPVPASSLVTGGVSVTVASLVPLVTWALNGFARPVPETVPYLLAAGLVTLTHLLANVSIQWRKK